MILVSGATGFIGNHLVRRLSIEGKKVRALIRPSEKSPALPPGVPVEAAITSLHDPRGLRAAMVGVETIYHLAGVNWMDHNLDWFETEVVGTRNLLDAARDARVDRIFFLSHLGADRAAAYPFQKSKGIAEDAIRKSHLDYTIIRSGLAFGPGDNFTLPLTKILSISPGFFPMPGDGKALIQPIWVDDLVSCLVWALDNPDCVNAVIDIGGPEHLTLAEIVRDILDLLDLQRTMTNIRPSYLRLLTNVLRFTAPRLPISNVWQDYFASSRVTSLNTVSRIFGLLPIRYSHRLDYLKGMDWRKEAYAELFGREKSSQ